MNFFKYLWAELRNNSRFAILFILNLSLGVSGFIAVEAIKSSVDKSLAGHSKEILGADLGISSRRKINQKELTIINSVIGKNHKKTQIIETYSMVASTEGQSRLVQIKAIQKNFPFYGNLSLKRLDENVNAKDLNFFNEKYVWAFPEVLLQLKLKIGDKLLIGPHTFTIQATIENDSGAGSSTSMAPKIYISYANLMKTGLMRDGSMAWFINLYKLPQVTNAKLEKIRDSIFNKLSNPDIRVYTHVGANQMTGRVLGYLNDFLGLTSLVAILLAALGNGFLFRSFLRERIQSIATLISLGLTHNSALLLYMSQIAFLGLIGSLLGYALAHTLTPILIYYGQDFLSIKLDLTMQWAPFLIAILIGTLGSLLTALPLLTTIVKLKVSILFQEKNQTKIKWGTSQYLSLIPAILFFLVLSILQANSIRVGLLFFGLFLFSMLFLAIFFSSILLLLPKIFRPKSLALRWALRDLSRYKIAMTSTFLALSLGILLINIIVQLEASLTKELQGPTQSKLPSLFLFDIQDDQISPLEKILVNNNMALNFLSPVIRSRILSVNDKGFNKGTGKKGLTREEEHEMRFRNRGFNLSFRSNLSKSETIVKGVALKEWGPDLPELPGISLEKRFAKRLKINIGDKLKFDIQGMEIEGIVKNFRHVRWTSFTPNFFALFSTGVLEDAPKTYLASIGNLNNEEKSLIQNKIVNALPNISIVDVGRVVKRVGLMMENISITLKLMAGLCFFVGLLIIYSISNEIALQRKWDIALLKALGAPFSTIKKSLFFQFGLVSSMAATMGLSLGIAISYILSKFIFESVWAVSLTLPILILIISILLSLTVIFIAINHALKKKVLDLL